MRASETLASLIECLFNSRPRGAKGKDMETEQNQQEPLERSINEAISLAESYTKSREMSLVITKLQEAKLWLNSIKAN